MACLSPKSTPIPTPRWKLRISKEKKLLELHLKTKTEKEWDFADFVCTVLRELAFVLPFVSGLSIVWMGKRKQNRLREDSYFNTRNVCEEYGYPVLRSKSD